MVSDLAALLQGPAALLWVAVAVAVWVLRPIVTTQQNRLTKMSVNASG